MGFLGWQDMLCVFANCCQGELSAAGMTPPLEDNWKLVRLRLCSVCLSSAHFNLYPFAVVNGNLGYKSFSEFCEFRMNHSS